MDWTQFDNMIDDEIKGKLQALEEGFKEAPAGKYEVVIEKMEMKLSQQGNPMTVFWLKVAEGEYAGAMFFANFVMKSAYGIHNVKDFMKVVEPNAEITFQSFGQWNALVEQVASERMFKNSYVVEVTETPNPTNPDKPYKNYKMLSGPYELPPTYKAPQPKQTY